MVENAYFNILIYCSDLQFQCSLFNRSFKRLEICAEHWIKLCSGKGTDGEIVSPLEIMAECTVCLSAMAAIRRMLFPSENANSKVRTRSSLLKELLNVPILKNISSVSVRNSWEHNDERLDKILESRIIGKTKISDAYVSTKTPSEELTVLRRFNPIERSIYFSNEKIDLKLCSDEIADLLQCIKLYFQSFPEAVEHGVEAVEKPRR